MKIKIKFLFLFLCFLLPLSNIYSQEECGFETPENYQTYEGSSTNRTAYESYCINVCFRILRNNDGTNAAINPVIIPQIMTELNTFFNPHRIYIKQVGTYEFIDNTNLNNTVTPFSFPDNTPNCINLFYVKSYPDAGIGYMSQLRAKIKGSSNPSRTTAHEIGHILNLLHTFECTRFPVPPCIDNPLDTSLCASKGDQICDTPADYSPLSDNNNLLPYPISSYNPDKTNLMSYHYIYPLDHFTIGQGSRMRNAIAQAPYLQSVRSYECAKIEGQSQLCPGNSADFFVSGAEFGNPTYNWSVSNNLQINGSSNNSTVNITKTNLTGGSNITLTINGTIIKTKRVRCFWIARLVGLYDWVSKDYGNMGLIVPVDSENIDEEDPTISYLWEIKENPSTENLNCDGIKPFFVGNSSVDTNKFISTTNQAIVNWGNCSNSYFITCYEITQSGEKYLVSENYVDVGDSKNNPCFKNAFQTIIAPNPVRNGQVNIIVNKPDNTSPCNYKNLEEPQFFNSKLDKINNSITIFDYSGNQIYSNVFQTNEFTIENLNLISGDNYVVNLFTNEGGFSQQVIIAE